MAWGALRSISDPAFPVEIRLCLAFAVAIVGSEVVFRALSLMPRDRQAAARRVNRGDKPADRKRRADRNRHLRQAFLEGAEERSRGRLGRGLKEDELRRILRRYPGDLPEQQLVQWTSRSS